jgi:hypothetical protein
MGSVGARGINGYNGSNGYRGSTGYFGSLGYKGSVGYQGSAGSGGRVPTIAFAARSSAGGYELDAWLFNEATLNIGNAFDAGSALFTAPRTGYYYFHLTGQTYYWARGDIKIYFTINDAIYTTGKFVTTKTYDGWGIINMSTIMYLQQGDYVYPYVEMAGGFSTWPDPETSSFDGFFIGEAT